jgi:hypothetical protein
MALYPENQTRLDKKRHGVLHPVHDSARMKKMTATIQGVDASRRVILHTCPAEATLDDYHRLVDENRLMMASVPYEVDLIMDSSLLRTVPPRFLSALLVAGKKVPDNPIYLTETRQQAEQLIAQHRHITQIAHPRCTETIYDPQRR